MLNNNEIKEAKRIFSIYNDSNPSIGEKLLSDLGKLCINVIEEQKKEIERFEDRLQISPYGDDKLDELEQALDFCKFDNEQLKAQNTIHKEVLKKAKEVIEHYDTDIKSTQIYRDKKLTKKRARQIDDILEAINNINISI